MVKTIVFDVGKVIWNYQPLSQTLRSSWAQSLGVTSEVIENLYLDVYAQFETNHLKLEDWFKTINPKVDPRPLIALIDQTFSDEPAFKSHLNQPLVDLISYFRSQKFSIGCLSNAEYFLAPFYQKWISPLFDYSIYSWEYQLRKPMPFIYKAIFNHGRWNPLEVVFVDNKLSNIVAAQKFGINAVLYKNYPDLVLALNEFLLTPEEKIISPAPPLSRPSSVVSSPTVNTKPSVSDQLFQKLTSVKKAVFKPAPLVTHVKLEATGKAKFGNIPMPNTPTEPNIIAGMVTTPDGKIIEEAIIEIQDDKGHPSRVLRSNILGLFKTTTPLYDGKYLLATRHHDHRFDTIPLTLTGQIVSPLKIQAIG